MKLSALPRAALVERLQGRGLVLQTGPFRARVRTPIRAVVEGIVLLYADNQVLEGDVFADYHVALRRPRSLRRWLRPQANFYFDGAAPFKPLPLSQALPMLEWGLNWCISNHAHEFLIIHAAAVEKGGRAVLLPGPPGAGKSTLTASLVYNGWRLLSDELTLLSPADGSVVPLARPISLTNRAIELISRRHPQARLSARCENTTKGAVALLSAPPDSVARSHEPASPAWIIFPRYKAGAAGRLEPRPRASTFIDIGHNAFNYSVHGRQGFELLSQLIERCNCYDFDYGDLDAALATIDALTQAHRPARAMSG